MGHEVMRSAPAMVPFVTSVRFAWAFIALATLSAGTLHPPSHLVEGAAVIMEKEVVVVLVPAGAMEGSRGAWSGDHVHPHLLSLVRSS